MIMISNKEWGVLGACVEGFMKYDGRMISPASILQHAFLYYFSIEWITLIYNLLFLYSGFVIAVILQKELQINFRNNQNRYFHGLLFTISFWLGSYGHLSETVYWATGGGYTLVLFFMAIWILMFRKWNGQNISILKKLGFALHTLLLYVYTFKNRFHRSLYYRCSGGILRKNHYSKR